MSFEKKSLTNLLIMYKNSPYLWDKTHELYSIKDKKQQAYKNLLDIYNKKYRANLSIGLLKKKKHEIYLQTRKK